MSTEDKEFKVRSKRQEDWFWIDNEFVENGYLALNKSVAAVYLCLCKYANNKTQDPHPSLRTMSKVTGLDRNTIRKNIELLEKYQLVHISTEQGQYGVRYVYNLLDKTEWLSVEDVEAKEKEGGEKFTRSKIHPVKKLAEGGEKFSLNKTNKDKTINNNIYSGLSLFQIEFFDDLWKVYPIGNKNKVSDWIRFNKPDQHLMHKILTKIKQFKKVGKENGQTKWPNLENWLEGRRFENDYSMFETKESVNKVLSRQSNYDQPVTTIVKFDAKESDIDPDKLRQALCEHLSKGVVDSVFDNILLKVNGSDVTVRFGSEFDKERAEEYEEQLHQALNEVLQVDNLSITFKT